MAIYHLSVKPLTRSSGRRAPAAAAYRSGTCIRDHFDGQLWDFTSRDGIVYTGIELPPGAPSWALDREKLWNAAERAEDHHPRRDSARTAREIELALPAELTIVQNIELARAFARELTAADFAATDVAVHVPEGYDPERPAGANLHAHLLRTTRRLAENGLGEKTHEWDRGRSAAHVMAVRVLWAERANDALALHGHAARIDHRSHRDAERLEAPTKHLGHRASGYERHGIPSRIGEENRAVARQNVFRLDLAALTEHLDRAADSRDHSTPPLTHLVADLAKPLDLPFVEAPGDVAGIGNIDGRDVAVVDVGPSLVGVPIEPGKRRPETGDAATVQRSEAGAWVLLIDRFERIKSALRDLSAEFTARLAAIARSGATAEKAMDDAHLMRRRFVAERLEYDRERQRRLDALEAQHADLAAELERVASTARSPKARALAEQHAAAFVGQCARERKKTIRDLGRRPTWARYVADRAARGDDVAIAVVYRIHARDRATRPLPNLRLTSTERTTPTARTLPGYTFRVEKDGTVSYMREETVAFRDLGNAIEVIDREAVATALRLSAQKWTPAVGIRGDNDFRSRTAEIAAELGIAVQDRQVLAQAIELFAKKTQRAVVRNGPL